MTAPERPGKPAGAASRARPQHVQAQPKKPDFERRSMVQWFAPRELVRAAVKALLSGVFGAYADKREIQAALGDAGFHDYSGHKSLWLDYVADTGDGWDSTYTIARLVSLQHLALKDLALKDPAGADYPTERGQLLLFGGDQVYPTAHWSEYWHRFQGPYRAAGATRDGKTREDLPHLFAIPGNHDWYDGLTSFLRLICQGHHIGGWQTRQTRSYFAIKLAHDWWIWGIDVQLETFIDDPQIKYFRKFAEDPTVMPRGSKVVVLTALPTWIYAQRERSGRPHQNFDFLQHGVIQGNGHHLAAVLTGDLHTYARYDEAVGPRKRQWIVAGGGGAYLFPTHRMPEEIDLVVPPRGRRLHLTRGKVFPSACRSHGLALGSLLFPIRNPKFGLLLGSVYLLLAWLLDSAGGAGEAILERASRLRLTSDSLGELLGRLGHALGHSPAAVLLVGLLMYGLVRWCDARSRVVRWSLGLTHTAIHLALLVALVWVVPYGAREIAAPLGEPWPVLLAGVGILLLGGLAGASVVGLYLFVADLVFKAHTNDVFACQRIPHWKNFLRLRLDAAGGLTVYPVGVPRVETSWKPAASPGDASAPWFEPTKGNLQDRAELIEAPIPLWVDPPTPG